MSPKEDSKSGDTTVTVNADDFTRTRDNVLLALAALQSAVSDLSRAYLNHANTVLNRGPSTIDLSGITHTLTEGGFLNAARAGSPGGRSDFGDKKKRKRAPHDPNAPKRALTPYFLYMQHNRHKIAKELPTTAKPKEVADEGTRRWAAMNDDERDVWKNLYAENLARYRERMKAYKAGLPVPEDDGELAADQLLHGVHGAAEGGEEGADEEEEEDEDEEEEDEEEESEKEPTPPPRSTKRRRTGEHTKPVSTPPSTKRASPEKKKKAASTSKAGKDTPSTKKAATETPKAAAEDPKSEKKRSKKKARKSDAGD